jgi:hypothetical protein
MMFRLRGSGEPGCCEIEIFSGREAWQAKASLSLPQNST